ncbi:MAG: aquaporin NIP [Maribacter sp.]|jgi:aquaporin NIP
MIYSFGNISGAHINPTVSIAFSITDRFEKNNLFGYIVAQLLGAFLASGTLRLLFIEHENLGATVPFGNWHQSFILEVILTYFLMIVIFICQSK